MIDPENAAEFEHLGIDQVKARVHGATYGEAKLKQARQWLDEKAHGEDRAFKAQQLRLQHRADRKSTWAFVVSLGAVAISAGGVYLSNFYKPEDLRVTARLVEVAQVGTNKLDISVVFTNGGKHPVAISEVLLALNYGPGATVETATDWKITGGIWLRAVRRWPDGTVSNEQDGTAMTVYSAKAVRLNNQDVPTTNVLVNEGSVALLQLSFAPNAINMEAKTSIVQMIAIEFYDKNGALRRKIIPLGIAGNPPGLWNPAQGDYSRLLP